MSLDVNQNVLLAAICAIPLFLGAWTVYSVYFSTLAKFPGPKLAAATLWYEFYYDVVLEGQYTFKIKELHKKYGPIIRISPYELHIDEPDYYEKLYSQHEPRDKYLFYVNQFALHGAGFGTVDHKLHRARRAAMNPFFSKGAVMRLQPMLHFMIEKLCGRIDEFRASGQPMRMKSVYMCLTTDIITLYALNRSWNHLDTPDFSPFWVETIKETSAAGHFLKQFPFMFGVIRAMPISWIGAMNPGMVLLLNWQKKIQEETQAVIDGKYKYSQHDVDLGMNKTVFHALLESDLPPEEKLQSRMWQEGQAVVGAGADTSANSLTVIHYFLLENRDAFRKLREELEKAMPDKFELPKLNVVEQLPYLNAVLNEGLRLSYGVSHRLQRAHPTEIMKFHDWEIPAGTPVGMTAVHIHHNEEIFPDSRNFKPERWLEKRPAGSPPLERYLVSFCKGSRSCVGINLAKAELFLTIATVFRRYEHQELFETTRLDVDLKHDMFLPQPDHRSKGVRVVFK